MKKFIPLDKMSKKAKKAVYSNRRLLPPRTAGAHRSAKDYDRSKEKIALRKSLSRGDL